MSESERGFLRQLDEAGDKGVARSNIPKCAADLVQQLLTARAVRWQVSGRGQKLSILNRKAFGAITKTKFPLGLTELAGPLLDRASAVMLTGDAKRASRGRCHGIFLRSNHLGCVVTSAINGVQIPVYDLTQMAGGAALLLNDQISWSFTGTVAVIENAEAFWQHDRVLDIDLAIYSVGRMSSRLLTWLASPPMQACQYVHWGDYDPVGAAEYLRLLEHCPNRVSMYLPESLDELLSRHGKCELITKQVQVLHGLRQRVDNPIIQQLIGLWDRYQRGLEQEILLAYRSS